MAPTSVPKWAITTLSPPTSPGLVTSVTNDSTMFVRSSSSGNSSPRRSRGNNWKTINLEPTSLSSLVTVSIVCPYVPLGSEGMSIEMAIKYGSDWVAASPERIGFQPSSPK